MGLAREDLDPTWPLRNTEMIVLRICRPKQLPIPFQGVFEVYDTIAALGIWGRILVS